MPRIFRAETNPDHDQFYVSAIEGPRTYLVAGPYSSHREAQDAMPEVRAFAEEHDGRAHFMAWGTCSTGEGIATPLGRDWRMKAVAA
ncbi:hypothetical protein DSD19_04630 [Rhodovulum sp. BSW8]|uniref:hypothetical protein n=1 Tax=Rhodovulum sp. BSW8 TaxID=2259645 RepID=UPI000DE41AC6|nr:hypothetical protein [Rhodovulum sp. BSW8]RBO54666.1 hypothetical protein DSD19_04630 [Rhodovulum sp. BSW8]